MQFGIWKDEFVVDGEPVRILSGAIHYFRVVPEYWEDRLLKLKACGLNTVETYVAWNVHEPRKGQYDFSGMADIVKFIELAQKLGLWVIVRPGPFICAEWEFGGFPGWLLNEPGIRLRCFNRAYFDRVDAFFDILCQKLKPLLCTHGGPVIALQVENEYGSFGNDKKYLEYLKQGLLQRGMDVLLFTSDGPEDLMLSGGTLPGVLKTVNFGSKPEEALLKLRKYQPEGPVLCTEYWNGWFDHWGEVHHTRPFQDAVDTLDQMLSLGYSVNLYMFHGGTNFGFYNGANYQEKYAPTVTSYDYDAAVSEDGTLTPKYFAFKEVISKYVKTEETMLPPAIVQKSYGKVELKEKQGLFASLEDLSEAVQSPYPVPMESVGQNFGFILYRTKIKGPLPDCEVDIREVHDRALIYVNGKFSGTLYRGEEHKKLKISFEEEENVLDILVENLGRVNYGPYLADLKGITENVRLNYQFQYDWHIYPLPLDNTVNIRYEGLYTKEEPVFYKGIFQVDEPADTFLSMADWSKGVVWINGFNLGRYWEIGPQKTLYIPAPLLKAGSNEITVFELHGTRSAVVELTDRPDLG